jgi:glucose-6-phosphate isomerase
MNISFTKGTPTMKDSEVELLLKDCEPVFALFRAQLAQLGDYSSPYSFIKLPHDQKMQIQVATRADQKKQLHIKAMVIVGIGGSNLGARAVWQFLLGSFDQLTEMPVYYADTVDTDYIGSILHICQQILENNQNILVVIVSKSGHTVETVANGQLFVDLLFAYKKNDFHHYIVAITDHASSLWQWAQDHRCDVLEIPKVVGGRYSIMSAAGLFPLAMSGINITELCQGAVDITPQLVNNSLENISAVRAAIIFILLKRGYTIHDLFVFGVDLEGIGKWYRQLMGESLAKEYDITDAQVWTGITPTVSVGTIDLHSVGQLYLGGPYDKVTTFLTVQHQRNKNNVAKISNNQEFSLLVEHISGHTLPDVMNAIVQGTMKAYGKNNRPFLHINLPKTNAYTIGQFMQMSMIEMVYLAHLMNVNAFDQPQVEFYKQETRTFL